MSSDALSMDRPESTIKTILKVGATVIAAAFLGGMATRRIGVTPLVRGLLRGGVALAAAIALRKKTKSIALGLGVYGMATMVEGYAQKMETDRYLSGISADARFAPGTPGAVQGSTQQLNAASGYGGGGHNQAVQTTQQKSGYLLI